MTTPEGAVVVGVDGSPSSHAAVSWAADHAREVGRALVLLHAQETGRPTAFPSVPPRDDDDSEVAPYTDALGDVTHLAVHRRFVDVAPAKALVAASGDAAVVVLGRPRGRVASWPGPTSVTRRVLAGARCPVVLVPHPPGATS